MKEKLKVIAYYLPQFHTIPENDEWWGKGFTEWVNVKKAKPLFKGHKQPNIPAIDLGYYNLLDDEVRRKQTALAKDAGIDGFCYWHYWFGNGKELLEIPFKKTLADKSNDIGFCFGWANETWKRKQWNKDGAGDVNLAEQLYPGEKDIDAHFYAYINAFKDKRYIKCNGKLVFLIYRPLQMPDRVIFIKRWNELAKKEGLNGFCFVAELGSRFKEKSIDSLREDGFDYVTLSRYNIADAPFFYKIYYVLKNYFLKRPLRVIDYSSYIKWAYTKYDNKRGIIPGVCPRWDHSPRSGNKCTILHQSTPKLFGKLLKNVLKINNEGNQLPLLFLKSWNEWGEGNYIEPDTTYGKQYIEIMGDIINGKDNSI